MVSFAIIKRDAGFRSYPGKIVSGESENAVDRVVIRGVCGAGLQRKGG